MKLYSVNDAGLLTLNFHEAQTECWDSPARFTALVAGTQSGKTSFGPWWLYKQIQRFGSADYLAVSSTHPLFKKKMLPEILIVFRDVLKLGRYWAADRVFELRDPETGEFWAEHSDDPMWGRIIMGSAQQGGSLESATAAAAWEDECGQDEYPLAAHEAVVRRLSLAEGPMLLTTTPYNLGWLKTEVIDRARGGDRDYRIVHADSTVNPSFPRAEFERAKRTMPAWKFNMMYRGLLDRPPTMIYGDYLDQPRATGGHLVEPFAIPAAWPRTVGLDFGAVNTALLWIARDPTTGVRYCYRESLEGGRTTNEHARQALIDAEGENVDLWVGGAKGETQQRMDWNAAGVPVVDPIVAAVEAGIDRVIDGFKTRTLFVFNSLPLLRDQLGRYSRKADAAGSPTEEIKDKAKFHLLDALRYAEVGRGVVVLPASAMPRANADDARSRGGRGSGRGSHQRAAIDRGKRPGPLSRGR